MTSTTRRRVRRLRLEALELRAVPATFAVTLLTDTNPGGSGQADQPGLSGDLRYCVGLANAQPDADTVEFGDPTSGKEINLADQIEIKGPTALTAKSLSSKPNINGQSLTRHFRINAGTADVSFDSLTFQYGNAKTGAGGSILVDQAGLVTLTDCSIQYCNAATTGGAIAAPGGDLALTSTFILDNTAASDGGGIWIQNGTLAVSATSRVFSNDALSGNGGGVFALASTITFANSEVSRNEAKAGAGGGLYADGCVVTSTATRFGEVETIPQSFGNRAVNGAGIYSKNSTVSLGAESEVTFNVATGSGGGTYTVGGQLSINGKSLVASNAADLNGGGCYLESGTLNLGTAGTEFDCMILSNTAIGNGGGGDGGGVFVAGGTMTGVRAEFRQNGAVNAGGGIAARGGVLNLSACLIVQQGLGFPPLPERGGGIYSEVKTVLGDCTITNNVAQFGAGVEVASTSASLTMTGCVLTTNYAGGQNTSAGGGVLLTNVAADVANASLIRNTTFTDCKADNSALFGIGGGVAIIGSGRLTVDETAGGTAAFIGCFGFAGGGAIYVGAEAGVSPVVTLSGILFDMNSGRTGGALAVVGISTALTITACEFFGNFWGANTVTALGGALYITGETTPAATISVRKCTVGAPGKGNNNRVGGGIAVDNTNATVVIEQGTVLDSNNGREGGGGLAVVGNAAVASVQVMPGTIISGNSTGTNPSPPPFYPGGGVYVGDSRSVVQVSGTVISGNNAQRGGGIEVSGGSPTVIIEGCDIGTLAEPNIAVESGGGVGVYGTFGEVTIDDLCMLQGNKAPIGAAVAVGGYGTTTVRNSMLLDNVAAGGTGGAVAALALFGELIIDDCMALGNSAGVGGVLYVTGISTPGATVTVQNSTLGNEVSPNAAGNGGAVALESSNTHVRLDNCTIASNTATSLGGAIYVDKLFGSFADPLLIASNLTISSNLATSGGGVAAVALDGRVTFWNCTLSGNSAAAGLGGGVYSDGTGAATGGLVELVSSTIADNLAFEGGGVFIRNSVPQIGLNLDSTIVALNQISGSQGIDIRYGTDGPLGTLLKIAGTGAFIGVADTLDNSDDDDNGLFEVQSSGFLSFGDKLNPLNPLLRELDFNGGTTKTRAIIFDPLFPDDKTKSSRARDRGFLRTDLTLLFDQRGFDRVVTRPDLRAINGQESIDVGAYELQAPRVLAVRINGGAAQRSMVTKLAVVFNEEVSFPNGELAAFALVRTGQPSGGPQAGEPLGDVKLAVSNVIVNPPEIDGTTVELTFVAGGTVPVDLAGSLIDGAYQLTVLSAKVRNSYDALDADGDGLGGLDYQTPTSGPGRIYRLFGDNDGDADNDAPDFGAFRAAFGGVTNLAFDYDGDGDVDAADFGQFRARFGSST